MTASIEAKKKLLFLALFATGLSGIVAEYCLATLSTYFIGDSVKQWSIVISLMLFSMGLGSRVTRSIHKNVFTTFICTELLLSLVVSCSAVSTHYLAAYIDNIGIYIYSLTIITGMLIGMEIPLAIRLNDQFQSLKLNVANVLEKDYYGSLIGGLFFVFIGLPYLGLTITPVILGGINLLVAFLMLLFFRSSASITYRKGLLSASLLLLLTLSSLGLFANDIVLLSEQKKYKDKVIIQEQSMYQKIVVTQWKNDYWLYLNEHLQFSTYDEPMYHEVITHPMVQLIPDVKKVLILGGGDGCATRELLKYPDIASITLVDLDEALTNLFTTNKLLTKINKGALNDPRVDVINQDGFTYVRDCKELFDLIIIDLPDPRSVDLGRLYTKEFYSNCYSILSKNGGLITQAGSPYYTPQAYQCIQRTMLSSNLNTLPLHNQILSMGEWGWIAGFKHRMNRTHMLSELQKFDEGIETAWLNREAMKLITSFGKDYFNKEQSADLSINTLNNPVLPRYYEEGNWDTY